VLALLDAGWPVVVIDNLSTGFGWAVPEGAAFAKGDIGDMALVAHLIEAHRIGAIMHFAGSVVVPDSVHNPLGYYENNTVKSRALIESAVKAGVGHFIFSSTAATYGAPESMPVAEDARTEPINPYGWSKLMTERMLKDAAAAHPINAGILRYFNVAGADPRGRTGQSTPGATHLLKVACETALGKRPFMQVYGTDYPTPDGTGIRDYIHVWDLALAHVQAVVRFDDVLPADGKHGYEAINLGTGSGTTVKELVKAFNAVVSGELPTQEAPPRLGDAVGAFTRSTRAATRLEWRAEHSIEDGIRHSLEWRALDNERAS